MIRKKKSRRFFNKKWKAIDSNFNNLCGVWDTEKLHQLRVNAKKIKALAKLYQACSTHGKSFDIKQLQELFHTAGNIRLAELNIETLNKYGSENAALIQQQKELIAKQSQELCNQRNNYNKSLKTLRKRFRRNVSNVKNKAILSYYRKNLNNLKNGFAPPIRINSLHNCRKIIKKVLYPLAVMPASLVNKMNINEKYLNEQQDLIGKWHDAIESLQLLFNTGKKDSPLYHTLEDHKQVIFEMITRWSIDFDKKVIGVIKHGFI